MKPLVYRRADFAAYTAMALYVAAQILLRAFDLTIHIAF